jgi:hypothetical protein
LCRSAVPRHRYLHNRCCISGGGFVPTDFPRGMRTAVPSRRPLHHGIPGRRYAECVGRSSASPFSRGVAWCRRAHPCCCYLHNSCCIRGGGWFALICLGARTDVCVVSPRDLSGATVLSRIAPLSLVSRCGTIPLSSALQRLPSFPVGSRVPSDSGLEREWSLVGPRSGSQLEWSPKGPRSGSGLGSLEWSPRGPRLNANPFGTPFLPNGTWSPIRGVCWAITGFFPFTWGSLVSPCAPPLLSSA